jgi:hypothetical protein
MSEGVTPELLELVDKLRYDLTAAQGKLSELKRALAGMPQAPTKAKMPCPHCGLEMGSLRRLSEHLENMGPDHGFSGIGDPLRDLEPAHGPVKQLDDVLPPPLDSKPAST